MLLQAALITDEIVSQVLEIGLAEDPLEACGIITPDGMVVQVPNVSPEPRYNYWLDPKGLADAIYEYAARVIEPVSELERQHFVIWHTHPDGSHGPSRTDMRQKVEGFKYLVVSLPDGVGSQF